jgi:hypothetical protein
MLPEEHELLHAMPHIHIFFAFFYLTKYKKFIEMTLVKKKKSIVKNKNALTSSLNFLF